MDTTPQGGQPKPTPKSSGGWGPPQKNQYTFDLQITEECEIAAPLQDVFTSTSMPDRCVEWSPATLAVTDLTLPFGLGATWIHRVGAAGFSLDFYMQVQDYQPPHEITVAVRSPWNKPGEGRQKHSAEGTIRLEELDGGRRTRFTITARFDNPASLAGMVVYKLVGEQGIRQILRLNLEQMKAFLERRRASPPAPPL